MSSENGPGLDPEDIELVLIRQIYELLKPCEYSLRRRVVSYVTDRIDREELQKQTQTEAAAQEAEAAPVGTFNFPRTWTYGLGKP